MKISFASTQGLRIEAIDIVRALNMILMIFVNDLWSLKNIPIWLEHVPRGVDGMGLADSVFPAFLFIVGLSMPFAIQARRQKGATERELILHVVTRTIALLIMGVFLVNGETINGNATGMPRLLWNTICCLSFIILWRKYHRNDSTYEWTCKSIAILALLVLFYVYRGGKDEDLKHFAPQWWGILGLIGWSYLASGLVTVLSKNNLLVIIAGWVFFSALSILSHAKLIPSFFNFIPDAIRGGTLAGLAVSGALASYVFQYYRNKNDDRMMTLVLSMISIVWILLSIATRPYWGLAKLGATPAWLFLCSAFTLIAFLIIYWLTKWGKGFWFDIIKPAGTDTLLCYLMPYFAYALMRFIGLHLPAFALKGGVGLIKSFLFALLCALATRLLVKSGIKLKI